MSRIEPQMDGDLEAFTQAGLRRALNARAAEDARGPLYTGQQEARLLASRARRHVQFDADSGPAR